MRWPYLLTLASFGFAACSSEHLGTVVTTPDGSVPSPPPDASSPSPPPGAPATDAGTAPPADASAPPDAGGAGPVAHPALPQVPYRGGPLLKTPQMVVVTFDGDPNQAALTDHARWMMATWLPKVASEYQIGAGSVLGSVSLGPAPQTISETELETQIGLSINAGTFPAPGPGVFYMVYVPAATTLTLPGGNACDGLIGSHAEATYLTTSFVYGFVASCANTAYPLGLTGVPGEELIASRVVASLVTNPEFNANPAYAFPADPGTVWSYLGRDVTAFCRLAQTPYRDGAFYAQRIYSNAAAATGNQDPCVPADAAAPYISIASMQLDAQVAAGRSANVPFVAWSNGASPTWTLGFRIAPGSDFQPTVQIAPGSVSPGTAGTISVGVPAGATAGQRALVEILSQQAGSTSPIAMWPLLVVAQ